MPTYNPSRDCGADGFFHTPFAWFGDRAGFYGFRQPSWRRPLDNLLFARQFFQLRDGDFWHVRWAAREKEHS